MGEKGNPGSEVMLWRVIKLILKLAEIHVSVTQGDQLHVKVLIGGKVILDRIIDFIPGA